MLCCVTLGKSLTFSEPQALHLSKGDNSSTACFTGVLGGNPLLIFLVHRKHPVDKSELVEIIARKQN